ncbi:hypothetical protein P7K49_027183 [Saguinus oedipus]|uniref:Uncharacterized protein n=1 Tax=Saguinus oedipus TaxID=9490 RepID=A0ABQ9UHM6_SAGOE|nr:hypothetical protein P7K49_027183 [Saguinus oedipus]
MDNSSPDIGEILQRPPTLSKLRSTVLRSNEVMYNVRHFVTIIMFSLICDTLMERRTQAGWGAPYTKLGSLDLVQSPK